MGRSTTVIGGQGGGGVVTRLVSLIIAIAVVVFVVERPGLAADVFLQAMAWAGKAIQAGVSFLEHVAR